MALRARRRGGNGLDAWPGYVDALSTLLMVVVFVLLVFVLAQAFLTATLSGRTDSLAKVSAELAQLSNAFSLEKAENAELQFSVARLSRDLAKASDSRDALSAQVSALDKTVRADQAAIDAKAADIARLRTELDKTVQADKATIEARTADIARLRMELDKTVQADKATINARLSDIARLETQTRALDALVAELEQKVRTAAVAATIEQDRRAALLTQLAGEQRLGESARAQIALLNRQVEELKAQFAAVQQALGLVEQKTRDKDIEIVNLGQKLNAALVEKVEELKQYRSEFFGKLRALLANKPGIQVIGDRFVFQSEVLFPLGSADLAPAGVSQMAALAGTIKDIAATIPPELQWVLRVDGHTDPQPTKGGYFASNWELSAARAITVVKLLIVYGVPPEHLAASGFGEFQPFAQGDTPEAYAKDRRIELRLTDR